LARLILMRNVCCSGRMRIQPSWPTSQDTCTSWTTVLVRRNARRRIRGCSSCGEVSVHELGHFTSTCNNQYRTPLFRPQEFHRILRRNGIADATLPQNQRARRVHKAIPHTQRWASVASYGKQVRTPPPSRGDRFTHCRQTQLCRAGPGVLRLRLSKICRRLFHQRHQIAYKKRDNISSR
jgi:hypothetical protein